MRANATIGRAIMAIYKFLFAGYDRRASIRRQVTFEAAMRERLADLFAATDALLTGSNAGHPRPFGYVMATLEVGPSKLVFVDGHSEVYVEFRLAGDAKGKAIWGGHYEPQIFGTSRTACLDQCCMFVRQHWDEIKLGIRPS